MPLGRGVPQEKVVSLQSCWAGVADFVSDSGTAFLRRIPRRGGGRRSFSVCPMISGWSAGFVRIVGATRS